MSSNRSLQESLVRRNALTAVAAGLLSVLLTFLVMHLWRFDLAVPVVYWSDALYVNVLVKALTEVLELPYRAPGCAIRTGRS